jgi:predicted 3-demethylubiquinone-9 3-methyltransferase (glyoxalase superfamily)
MSFRTRRRPTCMPTITPNLWFDEQGLEAAELYTSVFPNSRINEVTHYGEAGPRPAGTVMTVAFELDGQPFVALNGGPDFTFSEAISFEISCESQEEVDGYTERLIADGGEQGPCGWVKDRYGLSWQVVPKRLVELLSNGDEAAKQRVMAAMLKMRKIDVAALEQAAAAA